MLDRNYGVQGPVVQVDVDEAAEAALQEELSVIGAPPVHVTVVVVPSDVPVARVAPAAFLNVSV